MTDRNRKLTFDFAVHSDDAIPFGLFLDLALERGLPELGGDGWATAEGSLDRLGEPLLRVTSGRCQSAVFEQDGILLLVTFSGTHVTIHIAAGDFERIETEFTRLREQFPAPDPSSAHEVPVTFWTYTPNGPQASWRAIGVPNWDEIGANYSQSTRERLGALMRDFQPAHGGQLVLWHGEAGTGKTFALRALAWEWRDWCQFHYIVDPDSFFGEHADYLMSVLMQPAFPMMVARAHARSFISMSSGFMFGGSDEEEDEEERPWRVLVLEDTGELLAADARMAMGQGLSRFLNVVDGLIGQGLRVLVLVTTNEPIRKLHPAVARPGRCAANVEFVPLAAAEAGEWLAARGLEGSADGTRTLASLYAQLEGRDPAELSLVGFGG